MNGCYARPRNSACFERFDKDETLDKIGVPEERTLIDRLIRGRFEVMIGTDCQADCFIEQNGLAGVIEKSPYDPGNSVDLYLGVSKSSEWMSKLDLLNAIIKKLVEGGFVESSAVSYYGEIQ